jgi:hypothetical protein
MIFMVHQTNAIRFVRPESLVGAGKLDKRAATKEFWIFKPVPCAAKKAVQ